MGSLTQLHPVRPDLDMTQAFLDILDPDDTNFSFIGYSEIKGDGRPAYTCRGTLNECTSKLIEWNADRRSVCVAVNQIKAGKTRYEKDVQRVRAVIVDDDVVRDKLRANFPLLPSIVVESSAGKFHYYFLCYGLTAERFRAVEETLIKNHGHDPQIKAPNAVLRMPGFLHQKGAPFLSNLVSAQGHQYTVTQILKAYPPHKDATSSVFYTKTLRKIERTLIDEGIYKAVAYEWTLQGSYGVRIRYSVDTPDGIVMLDQYVPFTKTKGGWIKAGYDSILHGDLVTLGMSGELDRNMIQLNVFEKYFGRKMKVWVGTVDRKRHTTKRGKFQPRPEAMWYSKVEYLMEAK